jgi:hypothetical protein
LRRQLFIENSSDEKPRYGIGFYAHASVGVCGGESRYVAQCGTVVDGQVRFFSYNSSANA